MLEGAPKNICAMKVDMVSPVKYLLILNLSGTKTQKQTSAPWLNEAAGYSGRGAMHGDAGAKNRTVQRPVG
jgi:hypothetical protein